jgi:CRP-like cAMP-binding protein
VEANALLAASKIVRHKAGDVIYEPGEEIESIYFPIDAVIAVMAILEDGTSVEISMTGKEGVVGSSALIGGRRALHWTRVSVCGKSLCIPTRTLLEHCRRSAAVQQSVLRAYRALFTQICQRSVCNVRHTLLQRLCVWLLMTHDRIGACDLPFTQEGIANRLSVRRAGISVAASSLQARQAVSYHRGKIVITNREVIEANACECYKILGKDFHSERLRAGALI